MFFSPSRFLSLIEARIAHTLTMVRTCFPLKTQDLAPKWLAEERVDKGSGKCDRKGVHRRGLPDNYDVARKQPRRGFQADDDDERCKRREKLEETALKRQARKGRTREGGTQGGKTADAPDD